MKFYVAGKYQDYERVREVQKLVTDAGHDITYDWTADVERYQYGDESLTPEIEANLAERDRLGVKAARVVIAVSNEHWCGTLIEIGIAAANGTPVWILGPFVHRHCIFFRLPMFRLIETEDELKRDLGVMST